MKGGITSGVLYAGAIIELGNEFRLCRIGGTSAGAIGAAVAAAAELRRQRGWSGGFAALLAPLMEQLRTSGFLAAVLQPTPAARPALRMLLVALRRDRSRRRRVLTILARLLAASPALTIACALAFGGLAYVIVAIGDAPIAVVVLLLAVLAACAAATAVAGSAAVVLLRTKRSLGARGSGFGLCSGMPVEGGAPALTPWLYETLQDIAGLDLEHPLTFRHLRDAGIQLAMITTDLGSARPVRLPAERGGDWFYDLADFARLFPTPVIEHLRELRRDGDGRGLRPLPTLDLPVIVALRMSVGFPLLLSAIPLHPASAAAAATPARKTWLIDGGVTSNFPVHFFDAWLPRRPTFGIDLRERAPGDDARPADARDVVLPRTGEPSATRWTDITEIGTFVRQLTEAALNWRDTAQAELPGYSDRVCQVFLRPDHGGLNLQMPPDAIAALIWLGREVGRRLTGQFDEAAFRRHQGYRYVLLMRMLQRGLTGLEESFGQARDELGDAIPAHPAYAYPFIRRAKRATSVLLAVSSRWRRGPCAVDFDPPPEPVPPAEMRVGPRV